MTAPSPHSFHNRLPMKWSLLRRRLKTAKRTCSRLIPRRALTRSLALTSPMGLKTAEAILVTDAVARFGGTLEMSGRPGDFLLLMGDGSVVYGRVLRARQRIYRLLASRPDRQERDEEVQLFFESFAPRN